MAGRFPPLRAFYKIGVRFYIMAKKHKSGRGGRAEVSHEKPSDFLHDLRDKLKWLDPFTYVDLYVMPVVNPNKNSAVEMAVYLISAFVFAWVLYNYILAFLLGTSSPLVIVYSGSMEPALYRGDVVLLARASQLQMRTVDVNFSLSNAKFFDFAEPVYAVEGGRYRATGIKVGGQEYSYDRSGPTVVYYSKSYGEDIIHRAVLKLRAPDGEFLLTYGDNNPAPDQECTEGMVSVNRCISPYLVKADSLKGKYLVHLPLLGYVKLLIFDDVPKLIFGTGAR